MLPLISAVALGFSAINAASAVRSFTHSASTASSPPPAAKTASEVNINAAPGAASGSGAAHAATASEVQDRFLKLLVTQMKNQDPLNPLDNAQVTSQMAQLSTVSGVDKLNTTLQSLSTALLASQSLQSASLIGRDVVAAGSRLSLTAGGAAAGIDLKQAADRVSVSITAPNGSVIRKLEMGAVAAGMAYFQWDGLNDGGARAADGTYGFKVEAARGNTAVAADTLAMGRVNAVSAVNGGTLIIDGGIEVSAKDIKRII